MIHLTQIHISFLLWKYKAKGEDLGSSKMWEEEEDEDANAVVGSGTWFLGHFLGGSIFLTGNILSYRVGRILTMFIAMWVLEDHGS